MKKIGKILIVTALIATLLASTIQAQEELISTKRGNHLLFNNGYKKGNSVYSVKCEYKWDTNGGFFCWKKEGIKYVKFTKYKNKKLVGTKTYKGNYEKTLKAFFKNRKKSNIYNNYRKMEEDLIDINVRYALYNKKLVEQFVDKKRNKIYREKLCKQFLNTIKIDDISSMTSAILGSGSKLAGFTLDLVGAYKSGKNLANAYMTSAKTFIAYGNGTLKQSRKKANSTINYISDSWTNKYSNKDYKKFKKAAEKRRKTGSKYLYNIYKQVPNK